MVGERSGTQKRDDKRSSPTGWQRQAASGRHYHPSRAVAITVRPLP